MGKDHNAKDETGKTYGRWTVLRKTDKRSAAQTIMWECQCSCEAKTIALVSSSGLRNGHSKSCGCLQREISGKIIGERSITHGESRGGRTAEYTIWKTMVQRCTDSNCEAYKYYGGRGITVCQRWLDSLPAFIEDMGRRPSSKHSIDRIDVNGNYEPSNCRWATATEQGRNKRNNVRYEFEGEMLILPEISERVGVDARLLGLRLNRYDVPMNEAVVPGNRIRKLTEADVTVIKQRLRNGERVSVIAKDYNVGAGTISHIKVGRQWKHVA